MGCYIHLHVEVKVNGKWEHWSCPRIEQHYDLFAKLAGVRGDKWDAIVPPRGLPDDMSLLTRLDYDYWEDDAHNASWLTAAEVAEVVAWFRKFGRITFEYDVFGCVGRTPWQEFADGERSHEAFEDARIVFWFDN